MSSDAAAFQRFVDEYVVDLMLPDIMRELEAARGGERAANFLCTLGLLCHTEALGHFVPEKKGRRAKNAFEAFFRRLGPEYGALLDDSRTARLYDDLRNGMAHGYVPKAPTIIAMLNGPIQVAGVSIRVEPGAPVEWCYAVTVEQYFDDFVVAADGLYRQLVGTRHPLIHLFAPTRLPVRELQS